MKICNVNYVCPRNVYNIEQLIITFWIFFISNDFSKNIVVVSSGLDFLKADSRHQLFAGNIS